MIPVQNVYYMLSYAFKVLNEQGYKRIATEEFNNTAELMAAILAKGIAVQLKRGLGKEYISQTEELSSLRGKIDIAESIKTQSMIRKKLICTYDDFSVNTLRLYGLDRKSTRLNSSHDQISYAVFCLKKILQKVEKRNSVS